MVAQLIFALLFLGAFAMAGRKVMRLRRNILLGQPQKIEGHTAQRWRNMLLVALGQQKMFKRWLPATMHLFVYVAFIITQIELIEIVLDGFAGEHRMIWHAIEGTAAAGLYTFVISFIEVLSVLALLATFVFLARRNLLKIPRFVKPEMQGWPKLDGNIILYFEILLVTCIFMMNAGDQALQARGIYHETQPFAVSQWLAPLLASLPDGTVMMIERIGWWGHLIGVLAFLNYLPHSKHLHIFLAFPNTYYAAVSPKGQLSNMEAVRAEVAPMFEVEESPKPVETRAVATAANPSERIDDIFGDAGASATPSPTEESLDDIFGDAGASATPSPTEESLDDIFGDAGASATPSPTEESLDDIFGDAGASATPSPTEESLDDIFGDAGASATPSPTEESLDDIFGDAGASTASPAESLDDIFGGSDAGASAESSLDDVFGGQEPTGDVEDLFGAPAEVAAPAAVSTETQGVATVKFGASDVFDLSWKNLLDAYTCTECGRCTSVCPANLTGKKLSPRKVMMDVRDRAEEIGRKLDSGEQQRATYDDGRNLFDYISHEELRACTTCNACVEACPVMINPLDIIVELRRNLILDQADSPESWNAMFTNIENNGAPWQFAASDRAKWVENA